jgi:hypothetical protein
MSDFETSLRERLATATRDLSEPADWDSLVSRSGRRRRRKTAWTVGGIGLAAALSVVVALSLEAGGDRRDSAPIGVPATSGTNDPDGVARFASPYEWAQSLPRGANARAAWEHDDELHLGPGHVLGFSDVRVGLIARTEDGFLVNMGPPKGVFGGRLVVISPTGQIRYVPSYDGHEALENAVSPDGSEIAYRTGVIDVATGNLVSSYPSNARELIAWTPAGIVYFGPERSTWLWTPGEVPEPIQLDGDVLSSGYGRTYPSEGCTSIFRVADPPSGPAAETVYTTCDERPFVIATDGSLAIAKNADVISLPDGAVIGNLPLPRDSGWNDVTPMLWEDNDNIVFSVGDGLPAFNSMLVRCTLTTETCERASESLPQPSGEFDAVPLTPGWTDSQSYYF